MEEVERWFKSAEDDLRKAKDNFGISNYDLASFLCQQAVEKSLKAFLIKKTSKFPKIHDLVKLGKLVNLDQNLLKICEKLTFVYTETRYPDVSERKYTKDETQKDIENTEVLIKWIAERL